MSMRENLCRENLPPEAMREKSSILQINRWRPLRTSKGFTTKRAVC